MSLPFVPGSFEKSRRHPRGFTLVELLVVIAIMAVLAAVSGPAMSALAGSNSVDKSITSLSQTLELARAYAMGQSTYVRVGFCQVPKSGTQPVPLIVVAAFFSSDGTLDNASAADMASATTWPFVGRPLVINNLLISETLGGSSQDLLKPSQTDISPVSRSAPGLGTIVFNEFIQFSPSGEARVQSASGARFIQVAMDRPAPANGKNPFALRLSGMNGSIQILRKENL